jgi:DNA-binding NarL/FixJ family response regulator
MDEQARGARWPAPTAHEASRCAVAGWPRATACAPITVLVAVRTASAFDAGTPDLATAPGIRWLAPHIGTASLLLPALTRQQPDVLLLAQEIFDEIDVGALEQLQTRFSGLHVLLVAQALAARLHEEVLRCRFHGELPVNCTPETCLKAIRAVCRGEIWLPRAQLSKAVARGMGARVFDDALQPVPVRTAKAAGTLSRREKEIVEFLRQGMTNKEIACRLDIKEDTVKKHLQGVFGKLGVRRRTLVALDQVLRPPTAA